MPTVITLSPTLLGEYLDKYITAYLNNIIIYSITKEETFHHTCNLTKRWRRTSKLTHTHLTIKNNRFSNF
jgi:hypothetical protein